MNEQAMLHIPESQYCYPADEHTVVLRLRLDRRDSVEKVEIVYNCKYVIHESQKICTMQTCYEDRLFRYYEKVLPVDDVRFAYVFRIWENGKAYYYSEDGLTKDYDFSLAYYNFFQLPYINTADIHRQAEWMKKAVFYQIFVDRFYRGNAKKKDDYINMKWGELPTPKSFAGGDLTGIRQKLDYIQGLGVTAIYLTPVFCSISNHKYDISDYKRVDEQFGGNEELKLLIEDLHKRGMKLVLDAVFNHCSERCFEFQDVLLKGRKSPYFDWFLIDDDTVDTEKVNYETFSSCSYMPKWNTSNEEVQKHLIDIALYWIKNYDIDGWRLDVADEVSHDFWRSFRKEVKKAKPSAVIIGENWHDANPSLRGDQQDGIMNYAVTKACLDYYAFGTLGAQEMAWKLNHLLMRNTWQANFMMLNLLDTHDTDRFYTSVKKNKDKVLSALTLICGFVGTPCIYYGTEINLEGGYDPDNRRCFDWEESHWDSAFQKTFRNIITLRREGAVQNGTISITAEKELLVIRRNAAGEEILLLFNQSEKAVKLPAMSGKLLIQNRKEGEKLLPDGFMVIKR